MKEYDFVVMGGGVAGLAFSKRISENGFSVLVLEKEDIVGGLSRTLNHEGFLLDFCAHRFHTNNKELLDEVLSLPELTMYKHTKKSRIFMFNKYLRYPFEIQNLLRAMPILQSTRCGISFIYNTIAKKFRKPKIISYKDWFVHFYGNSLYKVMCYPYTSKIWRMDPSLLSADWADQRFQGEKMAKLIKRVIKKVVTLDFSSYCLEDDELAPDGGNFYYPRLGIQEMPNALSRATQDKKGKVLTSVTVTGVNKEDKTVEYESRGKKINVKYKNLISTIPLTSFYWLQKTKTPEMDETFKKVKYMSIIFVYAFIDKPQVSNDHWLYFPDKEIIFNRAVEFSNWSPDMCPKGKTSVCFDITCFEGDEIWSMTDEELAQRVVNDGDRIDYFKKEEIDSTFVFRLKFAYPVYGINYKETLDKIVGFLETKDCYLLGRTGIFRYNNSDNSIEMGFALADNFVKDAEKKSIYDYTIKKISY